MPFEAIEKLEVLSQKTNLKKSAIMSMLVLHSDIDTLADIMKKETVLNEREKAI